MTKKKDLSRRDFIKGVAAVGAASAVGCQDNKAQTKTAQTKNAPAAPPAPAAKPDLPKAPGDKVRVVVVRDQAVLGDGGAVDPKVIAKMLDDGVMALLGATSPEAAWAELLKPEDTLGIKSNVWRFIPTPGELEQAIQARAQAVGIPAERIGVDDRGVLENPVFQKATALINARTLRTHHWSGIGSCIKNYIMFHPEPWTWHDDSCADLAGLWKLPVVSGKTRLNIQVALTPLFHGKGPHHYNAEYTWPYKGLILSQDPVATDATAVRLLEAKRLAHFGESQPFAVAPKHVQVAQDKHRLGVADADRIELVKIGWSEGVLI